MSSKASDGNEDMGTRGVIPGFEDEAQMAVVHEGKKGGKRRWLNAAPKLGIARYPASDALRQSRWSFSSSAYRHRHHRK